MDHQSQSGAMNPFGELLDEKNLIMHSSYSKVIFELNRFSRRCQKLMIKR
jgi:hypothetical protein